MEALIALAFIAAGLILIASANYFRLDLGEISKATILLLPLLSYLLLSGAITELEGLGWKAKFASIAEGRVLGPAKAAELLISVDEANKPNFLVDMLLRPCRPYYVISQSILSSEIGDEERELVQKIAHQVRRSMLCGAFEALVVVDDRFQPIGVLESQALQEILRIRLTARNLRLVAPGVSVTSADPFSEIIASELGLVLTDPRFQAEGELAKHVVVNSDASVEQTYGDLLEANAQVAMITDRRGRFQGIVTRSAIEGWILRQLISSGR